MSKKEVTPQEVTPQLLDEIVMAVENGEMLPRYIRENNININRKILVEELKNKFGDDFLIKSRIKNIGTRIRNKISFMIDNGRFDTPEMCDKNIAALNEAIEILENKKSQLMS